MFTSICTALVFLLIGLLFPHRPKPAADYDKVILLNEYKYKIYEVFALIPLFFFIGTICYILYLLGNDVQELYFRNRAANFAIYPPKSFWLVPGLCFGFGLIMPPMEWLYRLMLQEEYAVYIEYTNRKHGFDGYKVLRLICILAVAVGLLLSYLGLDWYIEVKGNKIVIDDFYALKSDEYTIQEILSITHYEKDQDTNGKVIVLPHYKIAFSDGRIWDTSINFSEVTDEKYTAIAAYLASKAGLEVIYVAIDPA